jgi:hypothetical protein
LSAAGGASRPPNGAVGQGRLNGAPGWCTALLGGN